MSATHSQTCASTPPQYNLPESELDRLFDSINGLFYTGGELSLRPTTPYYNAAYHLYKRCVRNLFIACMGHICPHVDFAGPLDIFGVSLDAYACI